MMKMKLIYSLCMSPLSLLALLALVGADQWTLPASNPLTRSDLYIYVYSSPEWDEIATSSMRARSEDEVMEASLNRGAGPELNATAGAFHTDQYQLYSLTYHRILKDPRRTLDPANATTFFVPYDLASDAAYYKLCAKNKEHKCFDFRKCPQAQRVHELLKESPWWQRRGGRDHLLAVGMNYAMDHYIGKPKCRALLLGTWACVLRAVWRPTPPFSTNHHRKPFPCPCLYFTGACANCTKIAIDDYSYLHSGSHGTDEKGDGWHAVPFPADFHWTRKVQRPFPWENRERPLLVSYIGSTQSFYNPARRLRGSLVHFCNLYKKDCVHSTYGSSGRSVFFEAGHNPLQLSARSVFCLQPIGDLMTRKGLFDSMLQGCLPVVFEDLTASVMYTWHWEEAFWRAVAVELPFHGSAHRYFDPIAALQNLRTYNASLIAQKQALLRSRVFELQYSLDHAHQDTFRKSAASGGMEWGSTWPRVNVEGGDVLDENAHGQGRGWPMRDAYDVTLDHVLGWHSGREADVRDATVPECWNGFLDAKANGGKGKCVVLDPAERPK